ncbi:zinc-binding dehydrogenase [Mycolicibacterium lacusdiani]|uniref:zinc-binding dehydrogenase n=1 Tax=Mycolicibacterium lacusdiani TaxID=2895283 RepID=UPI001F460620|nr:zinc-binding dehydrogenase [Mycolicibacterium lacusdiani]
MQIRWPRWRVLASDNVAVVPDALEFQTAAALPVAGVTALQIVRRLGADEVVVGLRGVAPVYGVLEHVGGEMLAEAFALHDGGRVISVGAASGQPTIIDYEAERMTMSKKRIEIFMMEWPIAADLQYVVDLAASGQLDAQIGHRDSWDAIDALLGRKVVGKVALTVR